MIKTKVENHIDNWRNEKYNIESNNKDYIVLQQFRMCLEMGMINLDSTVYRNYCVLINSYEYTNKLPLNKREMGFVMRDIYGLLKYISSKNFQ